MFSVAKIFFGQKSGVNKSHALMSTILDAKISGRANVLACHRARDFTFLCRHTLIHLFKTSGISIVNYRNQLIVRQARWDFVHIPRKIKT